DADGVAAADDRNPVGRDTNARGPAERLAKAVRGPYKEQKVKAAAEAEENIERSGAEHADGQHDAGREALGKLAVEELAQTIGDFERGENPADLRGGESQAAAFDGAFEARHSGGDVRTAEVERAVGQPECPDHRILATCVERRRYN